MKRKTDALTGVVLSVLALTMMVWVIPAQIPKSSDPTSMPPSFMANLTMGMILVLSLLLIVKAILQGTPEAGPVITKSGIGWLAFVVGSLVVSGFLIHYLGFLWGGMVVIAGYMACMGERRPTLMLPIAVGAAGTCYGVLKFVLKVL